MGEPSMPDLFVDLMDGLDEIEKALKPIGLLSGADVLVHLPTSLLREVAAFREEVAEAAELYEERGWDQDDPETPHVGLFEQWHDIVDYLYQQGQWADEDRASRAWERCD